jgi:hypothetical protein
MNTRVIERALWSGTALSAASAAWIWFGQRPPAVRAHDLSIASAPPPSAFAAKSLMTALDDAVSNDLFRPERTAPQPAHDSTPVAAVKPAPLRPKFVLRGLIGGPPWDVIIDGLPGRQAGTVVRDGETVAGFSIHVTAQDAVRVHGADTTWVLTLSGR